ncbi:MAG: glycosyltransferase family 39 protein [Acidobacteria bacterium]|nr:glycosyltransferase family 39 protein [Acidobacteriota bacterium]MBV9476051.1 glycosyltransferase family 39 protein [Acidobacteriota bacterium]
MSPRLLLSIWLLVVAAALAVHLGGFPLYDADEGRNAEVGREMAETNDYVMPRLDGLPYLDKPVVYFAAEAAAMELLGPTELAARLPAYLFTLATAAVLFWFARRRWGGEMPYLAAIVFLSMPLTMAFARTVIFDSALTFFVVVALVAFDCALEERNARWSWLAWVSMGFAMITKGPVTFVLVLFVAIPYAWTKRNVRVLFPPIGLALFALVVAPWVWGVTRVVPEFLHYVLVTETAERMATKALKRTGPPWYFVPYLIGGALPWSLVALFSWKRFKNRDLLFLILWLAIPFVFFSISQSKRPQYILPLMPALALLVARIWDEARTRGAAIIVAVLGALLAIAPLFAHRAKLQPELAPVVPRVALVLGIAFLIGGLVAAFAKRRELAFIALTLPVMAIPTVAQPLMQAIGVRRSAKAFAEQLAPKLAPSTEVIGVEAFTGSMAFYLRRPVVVVTEDASELTSNYLIRRYAQFTSNPASPLKPLPYFERSLGDCCTPRVYVVRNDDRAHQALLEARGWRRVAEGAHHVGYAR